MNKLGKQFKDDPTRRHEIEKDAKNVANLAMERERRFMEAKAKLPFHFMNTTFFTLSLKPLKKGMCKSFMVTLDKAVTTAEVKARLMMAFKDVGK